MRFNYFTPEREELVSDPFTLPVRALSAVLELPAGYPWTGQAPGSPPESIEVAVEVKQDGSEWHEATRVGPYSTPTRISFPMPRASDDEDAPDFVSSGRRPTLARFRILHRGRLQPRFELKVEGL